MAEEFGVKKPWEYNMDKYKNTWECSKCHRFCPNCAGRSCYKCCIKKGEPSHLFTEEEITDTSKHGQLNPGCLFHQPRTGKAPYFVKKWNPMNTDPMDADPKPLMRPPWPWEQPRYEPNMRLPSTYVSPAEYREEEELDRADLDGRQHNYGVEVPPLSYHLRQYYKTRDPVYILRH